MNKSILAVVFPDPSYSAIAFSMAHIPCGGYPVSSNRKTGAAKAKRAAKKRRNAA